MPDPIDTTCALITMCQEGILDRLSCLLGNDSRCITPENIWGNTVNAACYISALECPKELLKELALPAAVAALFIGGIGGALYYWRQNKNVSENKQNNEQKEPRREKPRVGRREMSFLKNN